MRIEGIAFFKMSGAGNDFLVIDNREGLIPEKEKGDFARKVCRRRLSVGADGILLVEPSQVATFRMRYFNADGTEGEMCGNGARCITRFTFLKGIAGEEMTIESMSGILEARVMGEQATITLNPVTEKELNKEITVDNQKMCVDYIEEGTPGLPHSVIFKDDLTMEEDIEEIGRRIRHDKAFPRGTNVNFCRVVGKNTILNRTYERGVERETLACGTGSGAAACAVFLHGMCGPEIEVKTKGGTLRITIGDQNLQKIYLTGDARIVYEGILREV
jgi:diaminopimelate epimerase